MIAAPMPWEPAEPAAIRRAMGRFATGIAVVSTAVGDELHGMTVNSLTSVSLDPPLLLVCLTTDARTTRAVLASGHFNVSVLDRTAEDIGQAFARRGADHYKQLTYERDARGIPELGGTLVDVRCDVAAVHEHGDHLVVVGAILATRVALDGGEPLVFFGGRFHQLGSPTSAGNELLAPVRPVEWEWHAPSLSW